MMKRAMTTLGLIGAMGLLSGVQSQPAAPATVPKNPTAPVDAGSSKPIAPPNAKDVHEKLTGEAAALAPLVKSDLAKAFLDATASLPEVGDRSVYREKDGAAYSSRERDAMAEEKRGTLTERKCSPTFYYYTGYGSPLLYVRALDLLAGADSENWGKEKLAGKRVLDFGYGSIGHLRILASLGMNVTGIEAEPLLHALYSDPSDNGVIDGHRGGPDGHLRVLLGRWPAEEAILRDSMRVPGADDGKEAVANGGYDLFMSKNTLKRGYIHPARDADPRRLVHLGVDDETYLRRVYDMLKPGGVFMIYNISPAQSPADKPYIPHADGECPFDKKLFEKVGFTLVEMDRDDTDAALDFWRVMRYDQGKTRDEMRQDLRAWWTMAKK